MILSKTKIETNLNGDYKIVNRFAWLPKKVDGFTIWLERYKEIFEYKVRDRSNYSLATRSVWHFKDCGGWDLIAVQRVKIRV